MLRAEITPALERVSAAYADRRWGRGWRVNPHGRGRAWDELDRYRNDPAVYLDKIETELSQMA